MNNPNVPPKILLPLDHTRSGPMAEQWHDFLKTRARGQPRIFEWCAETLEAVTEGFFPDHGPAASALFVGPSGVGKTFVMNLLAEFLFGDPKGFTRVDGQDISLEHNIARLTGAPPGYVGYEDKPMITQKKLDLPAHRTIVNFTLEQLGKKVQEAYKKIQKERLELMRHLASLRGLPKPDTKELAVAQKKLDGLIERINELGVPIYDREKYDYISLFLIDEIEKAHPRAFPNLMLRVLDEGELHLTSKLEDDEGDVLDFSRTIIIATSNLGSEEVTKILQRSSGRSPGYRFASETYTPEKINQEIYTVCRDAVGKFFSTEFVNRFGILVAAHPHSRDGMLEILEIEIEKLRERLSDDGDLRFPITLHIDRAVKEYLVDEVADRPEKGIRFLQQKLNRQITSKIPRLKSTEQLSEGDTLHISLDSSSKKKLLFQKEDRIKLLEHIIAVE